MATILLLATILYPGNFTYPASSQGPIVTSFTITPALTSPRGEVQLRVNVSGGTPPLSYSYAGLWPGCSSENESTFSCVASGSGVYNVTVTVHDSADHQTSATANLKIVATAMSYDVAGQGAVPIAQAGATCSSHDTACFAASGGSCTFFVRGSSPLSVWVNQTGAGYNGVQVTLSATAIGSLSVLPSSGQTTGGSGLSGRVVFTNLTGEIPPNDPAGGSITVSAVPPQGATLTETIGVEPPSALEC